MKELNLNNQGVQPMERKRIVKLNPKVPVCRARQGFNIKINRLSTQVISTN
jgi:hypothetical protein